MSFSDVISRISEVDLVIEVTDAREPLLTRSRIIERETRRRERNLIIAINKADLVPKAVSQSWKSYFQEEGIEAVFLAAKLHMGTGLLRRAISRQLRGSRGIIMPVGYPKTGKSTVLNALKGRRSASVSSVPKSWGYTKGFQLIRVGKELMAVDSPGVIPPDGDDFQRALRGTPPEKLKDPVRVASLILERVASAGLKNRIETVYGIDLSSPLEFLEELSRKRGWFYRLDKEPNVDEAARVIIRDYHEGKITYYSFPPKG
jgi:ribosome biogenesis GTPase A